jgi:hypothetical protein
MVNQFYFSWLSSITLGMSVGAHLSDSRFSLFKQMSFECSFAVGTPLKILHLIESS